MSSGAGQCAPIDNQISKNPLKNSRKTIKKGEVQASQLYQLIRRAGRSRDAAGCGFNVNWRLAPCKWGSTAAIWPLLKKINLLIVTVAVALMALPAQGTIVQSNTTYAAYADLPVSNSDLVNYGQPTLGSYTVSATSDSDETPDRGFITGTAGSNFSDITWFRDDNANDQLPGTITLNLDVSVNTARYEKI